MPPVRSGPTSPEAMSNKTGTMGGASGYSRTAAASVTPCATQAAAITVRPSRAVSRHLAMKGPKRCGAVMHAPRIPASHPGAPLVVTSRTIATTAPPSALRANVAARTYRARPPGTIRLFPIFVRLELAAGEVHVCFFDVSVTGYASSPIWPMAWTTLARPSGSSPRSGSGRAEEGTSPRSSARAAVTRRLP